MTMYKIVNKTTGEKRVSQEFDSMTEAAIYAIEHDIIGCNVEPAGIGNVESQKVDDK